MPTRVSKKLEIVERRKKVGELYLKGWGQVAIAGQLGVRQSTVCDDLKQLCKAWRQSSIRDFDAMRDIELEKLNQVEREAWDGFERSKQPHQSATTDGQAGAQKARRTVRNQYGDPRYLSVILDCIQARRELLGIDAPVKIAPTTPEGAPLTSEQRLSHIQAIISETLISDNSLSKPLSIEGANHEPGTNPTST